MKPIKSLKSKQSISHAIHDAVKPEISGLKKDDNWSGINNVFKRLSYIGFNVEQGTVDCSHYNINGGNKRYNVTFTMNNDYGQKIVCDGYVMACAAGTVENPWNAYDIIFHFETSIKSI